MPATRTTQDIFKCVNSQAEAPTGDVQALCTIGGQHSSAWPIYSKVLATIPPTSAQTQDLAGNATNVTPVRGWKTKSPPSL